MKSDKALILSFVAPLMIIVSAIGLICRPEDKKIFYVPIGSMGLVIIFEKVISRKLNRRNILNKIKSYKKS